MTVSEWIKKMIVYSGGNRYDIAHFLKVYAYVKTIGECEHLNENTHLHLRQRRFDIAWPLCREKYGSTDGKYQKTPSCVE